MTGTDIFNRGRKDIVDRMGEHVNKIREADTPDRIYEALKEMESAVRVEKCATASLKSFLKEKEKFDPDSGTNEQIIQVDQTYILIITESKEGGSLFILSDPYTRNPVFVKKFIHHTALRSPFTNTHIFCCADGKYTFENDPHIDSLYTLKEIGAYDWEGKEARSL